MTGKRLIILLAIVLLITAVFIIFARTKKPLNLLNSPSSQTWEIVLSYNNQNQTLSLKKLTLLDKTISPDYRVAADSPYQLQVLDKSSKVLYLTKIHITEEISHSIWTGYPAATSSPLPATPTSFETTVFIPYFDNAAKIQIDKDNKPVLTIDVKGQKRSFLNLIPTVFAQTSTSTSGPIKVVILYDGNFTLSQFQQQAQTLISALQGTPPYAGVNPPIFEFIQANSINHFECAFNPFNSNPSVRTAGCSEQAIKSAGYAVSPQAAKIIVLADTLHLGSQFPFSGLTNDIGGDISLIPTNPNGISFTQVAIHEFLGHAVGELYDRYALTSKPGIKRGIKSNCSDNSGGEAFWRQAGATGPYPQPCDSPNLYAPFPNDCPPPPQPPPGYNGPIILSRGSNGTIMGGCNPNAGFDSVEQAWIRTQIIPRYQTAVVPSPSPPAAAANDCSFNLTDNQIVRGEVLTRVSAIRANPSYFVSVILLNSRVGNFVGAVTPANSIVVNWNSTALFPNGPVTLRCLITDTALGGNTIFSKDITINVQN